ncbi:hypothetical protein ACLOJK_004158, partial [Asimina triloba]
KIRSIARQQHGGVMGIKIATCSSKLMWKMTPTTHINGSKQGQPFNHSKQKPATLQAWQNSANRNMINVISSLLVHSSKRPEQENATIKREFVGSKEAARWSDFGGRGGVFSLSRVRGQQGSNKVQGFSVVRAVNSLQISAAARAVFISMEIVGLQQKLNVD